jgi:hypothetical protein
MPLIPGYRDPLDSGVRSYWDCCWQNYAPFRGAELFDWVFIDIVWLALPDSWLVPSTEDLNDAYMAQIPTSIAYMKCFRSTEKAEQKHTASFLKSRLPYTDLIRTQTLFQGGEMRDFRFARYQTDARDGWNRTKNI